MTRYWCNSSNDCLATEHYRACPRLGKKKPVKGKLRRCVFYYRLDELLEKGTKVQLIVCKECQARIQKGYYLMMGPGGCPRTF